MALMHFHTRRLIVRATHPGDGRRINAAVTDSFEELRLWMPWAKQLPTLERSEQNACEAHAKFLAGREYDFNYYLNLDHTLIGKCSIHALDHEEKKFELGYWIRTGHGGKLYATEAVGGLLGWAFERFPDYVAGIRCDEKNVRSRRLAERMGFSPHTRIINDDFDHEGKLSNTLIYMLSPRDFPRIKRMLDALPRDVTLAGPRKVYR